MGDVPDKLFVEREDARRFDEKRHYYRVSDDGATLTSLCGRGVTRRAGGPHVQLVRGHNEDDSLCDRCQNTNAYESFQEHLDDSGGGLAEERVDDSRWERYQDWIDEREWGNDKSPEDIQADGNILVAPDYQRRSIGHERKLHAYERVEDGSYFVSKCGKAREVAHPDKLECMNPRTFVSRSSTCNSCATYIDEKFVGSAAAVDYDPFNVFDFGEQTDLPELPDEPDEYVCPDCGKSYGSDGIGQHWGHPKSDCEYPVPSEREQDLLIGLWLAGASIEGRGKYPTLRKTSVRPYPLKWLKHELGVWGVDVSKNQSHETQQSNVEAGFGYENAGSHDQYRLTTRTCPFLETLKDASVTDVELTPTAARILFSFRGHVAAQSAISLRHSDGEGLVELLHEAGFTETSLYEPNEGKNQWTVVLSSADSREFADWIGGSPIPGITQSSKQLNFGEQGPQGPKPFRRVEPSRDVSAEPDTGDTISETISLEPDWQWLSACLTKLGHYELARRAYERDLTPAEVYGEVLDMVYDNKSELPTPQQVAEA